MRGAYVIKCHRVERDSSGEVVLLRCSADLETLGKKPDGRKVKGVIHWVSASRVNRLRASLRQAFRVENPEGKDIDDYRGCLNPDSLIEVSGAVVEPSVLEGAMCVSSSKGGLLLQDGDLTATGSLFSIDYHQEISGWLIGATRLGYYLQHADSAKRAIAAT